MPDTDENRFEIATELVTLSELWADRGNAEYSSALRRAAVACMDGVGDINHYADVLGKAEEAL
ncbi:hypothetical protein SEA_SHAM4_95 [Mycobacterium phage Sham4]|uniref:hypothetical protein n=1 Tax=Mycobacterium phage Mulciber TaxID=1805459 RepID=UPI00078B86C4|nr:hypothetical protein BJD74_gp11 [Mycobacterium phage Mulciber]AXC33455.1 hypothetical protein SEA_EBONY_97 [Mycobacterium phage Ebony]AXH50777.1 hypothetical protein SEA_SNAPE_98 [Mycobacterium phage Snape]QBI97922.1 hypothetical protein SEA_ORANGE_98 [Mycobacterium phage Orange]QBI98260.1 hypothetical protein SEA_BOWTIE_94 [Mycobacterium phage Bowtie]QBI98551.1 hypothetical protein SEA_BUD_91 [Mycobacterium phage Bud]QBP32571.1 hypothetical protein SEA_FIBONACCI_98 [Mycobacterium phage Fi